MPSEQTKLKLAPETKAALKRFWDDTTKTWVDGFDDTTLDAIQKCPTLVKMLDEFVSQNGTFNISETESNHYSPSKHGIYILLEEFNSDQQYNAVLALAHEVGHALSEIKDDLDSADDYALSISNGEGEAIYYEIIALCEIYPGIKKYEPYLWKDNQELPDTDNLYTKVTNIIYGSDPNQEDQEQTWKKIEELGKLNTEMIWGSLGTSNALFTYDEDSKWHWLKNNTYLAIDYMEAQGFFYSRDDSGREKAIKTIEESFQHSYNIKVLVNKAYDYFGTDAGDGLTAHITGSVLGELFGYEVLWGGKGDDDVYGSMNKDILLGGDGDDKLYGYSNDDILAGNQGNDQLYGGGGNDTLYGNEGNDILDGGEGDDTLYGGEGNDIYALSSGRDVIYDSDKKGSLEYNGVELNNVNRLVTGGLLLYTDDKGLLYNFRPYDTSTSLGLTGLGDLYIYDENRNLIAKIADYHRTTNKLGLTFATNAKYNILNFTDIEVPNNYGSTFDIITSSASKTGQNVNGIMTGALNDRFIGGSGNEAVDLGHDSDYASGGHGNDYLITLGSISGNEALWGDKGSNLFISL